MGIFNCFIEQLVNHLMELIVLSPTDKKVALGDVENIKCPDIFLDQIPQHR